MVELDPRAHFIDGTRQCGEGRELDVTFPVTGEVLIRLKGADSAQVDAAIAAARRSFDQGVWRHRSAAQRAQTLNAMGECLEGRRDELVRQVMFDNGKTRGEAVIDVMAAAGACRAAASSCLEDKEITLPEERGVVRKIWREAVGVVAAITPFNAPLMFAALKSAPALAAGNSVVLKPSERAPLLPVALCEAGREAGLPDGVLNLIHGTGEVAAALCEDDRVDMISLTGGVATGTAVMRAAAPTIKNVLLELGGKSAHIILADADLSVAIGAAAAGIFRNAGQRCFSGSRLILEEKIADEVEAGVVALAESLVVGDPFEETTQVGAMIDEAAVESAETFVARACDDGLTLAAGGARLEDLAPGAFFQPTVLTGASASSFAARTEVFGPILTIIRVPDADAAVAAANETRYGLAGGLWTGDVDRALEIAREIPCGYFWINTYGAVFGDVPFGGYGRSGIGREGGQYAYDAYTELKSVLIDTTGGTSAPLFDGS